MNRGAQIAAIFACGIAGLASAVLLAAAPGAGADDGTGTIPTSPTDTTTPTGGTTGATTSTGPTTGDTTTTAPTTPPRTVPLPTPKPKPKPAPKPTPKPKPKPKPKPVLKPVPKPVKGPKLIAPGVTVGGTLVGGLTAAEARTIVQQRFARPLTLVIGRSTRVVATPQELGATAHLTEAIGLALRVKRPGFIVPLQVDAPQARAERLVARLAKEYRREAVDAQLKINNLKPFATRDVPGRRLREVIATRAIVKQLKTHERAPVQLDFEEIMPKVTSNDLGEAIVIERGSNRLLLYKVASTPKLIRAFRVATGRSEYPTPLGKFEVINKQLNPWWYPPTTSAWAKGKEPVPPGPGNPLGTRWMGISSPYVGIHGTPDASSIGYSASHGCIRMLIPEVEWLFGKVDIGTPVFIVAA